MVVNTVCRECNHEFVLDEKVVKQRTVVEKETGNQYVLTYYYCPGCRKEHIVQMDDNNSMELFKRTLQLMKEKVMASRMSKNVSKKAKKEFKKSRNLLTSYRTELMVKYEGKRFIEATGFEFDINFTMGVVDEGGEVSDEHKDL